MPRDGEVAGHGDNGRATLATKDQAGLRRRIRRAANQIREQHERIAPLFVELNAMLTESRHRDAQTTAFRLQGALRAHFLLEEQIVFPSLRALRPNSAVEYVTLLEDHVSLEASFSELIDQILSATTQTATESLRTLTAAIVVHERREESLLQAATES